jgi:hypothetical protein
VAEILCCSVLRVVTLGWCQVGVNPKRQRYLC